ncbi:polyribonucleotide nucleotidyltransferase [candidate division KSB1 bacterium]|nr:polyribonucleotide nucleotidyltransferase [candidate division KSB1 bacterium]
MVHRKESELNGQKFIIETGKLAKQANGSAWIQLGETIVLATAVCAKEAAENQDFFPLSVDYREKAYAIGKIPGGFLKREGRPTDSEILNARLVDRPIRPLFPKEFRNEVQVMITVLSADRINDADVLGITGASIALCLSDIPFEGPIAGARIGRVNGEFVLNPTFEQKASSDIDLIIAASEDSILMVEGEAQEISEEDMLNALIFGHEQIQTIISLQKELITELGKPKLELPEAEDISELEAKVNELSKEKLSECISIPEKEQRHKGLDELVKSIQEQLAEEFPEKEMDIAMIFHDLEKQLMRSMVLEEGKRLDGRGLNDIREIYIETGLLPRVHGSALFQRGQTQALATSTLGTKIDEQRIEGLEGDFWKNYMLHYNFPPFCTGEVKPIRGVSRREVGHGNLAERAIKAVIPNDNSFPYTLRIVSDVLESNGSSSMATVCAGSLSLMDAGVPIKSPVAGIAMGLVKEEDKLAILTDILGDEDHMGDMDFKVAGTRDGITACQMDIKIKGISPEIMREALARALDARLFILDKMASVLPEPRKELSTHAPRILTYKISNDLIGSVIGPGGKTIREITEKTGATINIDDDGTITIASVIAENGENALQWIKNLTAEPEVGKIYDGKVKKIMNFGAFIEILPGKEGLLHISQIDNKRVERVEDVLKVGDPVQVKLLRFESDGKMVLSRKVLLNQE